MIYQTFPMILTHEEKKPQILAFDQTQLALLHWYEKELAVNTSDLSNLSLVRCLRSRSTSPSSSTLRVLKEATSRAWLWLRQEKCVISLHVYAPNHI